MTKSIFRPTRIKDGKRIRARMYRLAYQLPGMPGKKYVSLKTSDKQVAERKADDFLRQLQQEEAGIIAPRKAREAARKPICEHLDAYVTDLSARGRDCGYCYNVEKRLSKLLKECNWRMLTDVTAQGFQAWRAQHSDLAAKTLKDYQDSMTAFLKWLEQSGLIFTNALKGVARVETKGKRKFFRRAFTFDELNRLQVVAGERWVGYMAAFFTGLRRSELAALEWGDIHLEADPPCLTARASTTKNGQKATIRLHPQLHRALVQLRPASADIGQRVLSPQNIASMWMMRKDLEAAGIPYIDNQGRHADFHALRVSLDTHLGLAKIDLQTRKEIMRHSDIKLTADVYTDKTLLPVMSAVTALPSFGESATLCATNSDISGHLASQAGTNAKTANGSEVADNEVLSHELAQDDAEWQMPENGCRARIRTLTKRFRISCATITPRGSGKRR